MRIRINVYSFFDEEGKVRYPLYATKKACERIIDLIYWDLHNPWINHFWRFMADLSRNNILLWCRSCLGQFDTVEVLKRHNLYCRGVDTSDHVLLLRDENRKVRFANEPYASRPFQLF